MKLMIEYNQRGRGIPQNGEEIHESKGDFPHWRLDKKGCFPIGQRNCKEMDAAGAGLAIGV